MLPKEMRGKGIVPCDGLDDMQRGQIANWIACNIPDARQSFHRWFQGVPLAHAITLVIVSEKNAQFLREFNRRKSTEKSTKEEFILEAAWKYQCNAVHPQASSAVDIDKECLSILEEGLFTRSQAAGQAGSYQWGLDAGDHQNRWNPYDDLPSHWYHDDELEYEEDIYEVT